MPKKLTSQKDAELNGAIQEMLDSGIGESDINSFVADFINQYGVDEAALSEKKNEVATPTSGQGVSGVGTSNTSSTRMAVGASPSEKASSLGGYSVSEMLSGKALVGGVPQTKEVVEVGTLRGDPIMYNIDVHEAKRGKEILSGKSQKPVEERFTEKIVVPKATKQDKKNAANKLASTMFPSLPESELSKIAVGLEDNVDGNYALSVKNKQADDDYVAAAPLTDVLATMQQRRDDIGQYGSKDKMIAFEQSKQGKVLEYANMIVRGEPLSAEDNAYLRQAAPQTYSDLLKLEKSPNGETITDVNVIAEIRKPKVDSILNEQGALRTQQDIAAFQGVVPNLGDIGSGMKDYIETIGSQEQAALKKIEDKYPIQFVSRKNGEAMERVPQDRPQEYYDEINKTKQPFAEMRYKGANADASLYALKNKDRGVDALVVGEKFFKNLDPTSYKTYLNGGSESRDYKILAIQKGIEVMANSGDPALIEQSKIQRAKFEAEYPDYNKVDVLKKLAFEKIKRQGGANWIYNDDFITIEEGDELAKQLSAKDKKTWNWIKQNEIAQRYTNNPQLIPIPFPSAGGLVNELATGFMMPIKGTFNTVVGATESSQEKANRALQNDYLSQKLFDREQGEKRVAELRAKKGKTVDDIKEIIAEEERLGLKSSKQITGDGMAGLTGQVVGQATLGRLATPVVSGLGRGLSALPQLERVAKLGAYMSDIKNATNLANSGIAYLSSYDDARLEAERIMPNGNIVEKSIYASGVAALNAATERIFKDEKIFDALRREVAPELAVLARELSRGNITESALRGSLKSLITDIGKKYIPSIAIENQKEALEEVATSVGTSVLKGLGRLTGAVSEKDFVVDDELDAMYNTWLETTISGIPTGIMAGVGDVRQNRIGKNSLYQLSIDPTKQNELKDVIRAQVVQGKMSDDESMEKIQIINALSDIGKNTIPLINKIKPLTTPEKAQLTNLLLAERKLKKDIKNPRFEDVKGVLEKQLSEVVSKKDKIINGEVIIDNDLVPMTPKEWEEKQKKQAEQDAELKAAIDEKLSPTQTFGVVDNADGTFTVVNEKGAKEIFKTKDEADARVVELSSEIIAPDEGAKIESAVIEIGGKTYEGKNHAEAILSAKADGQDISKVDRQAQGKFKLSDGTIIDRAEAKTRFGQDRSEMIIPQDEAANKANEEYAKIAPRQGTPEKISQPIELSIDTEEAAPTTAEPQQDIEAKKADIEKRREGENNRFPSGQTTFKKINPDGENTEVTDRQKATIERVIDGNIKEGKTPAQIVETLNHAGYVVLFGNETTTLLNYLEDRINGAISIPFFEFNSKLRDKINAKYDAELKALEATPAAPQQDNTALSDVEKTPEAAQTKEDKIDLTKVEYELRYPKDNEVVFVDPSMVLNRLAKDEPDYDVQNKKNQIGSRVQKAKDFIKNYANDARWINMRTGERSESLKAKFAPSIAQINNGKISFEDGRHRILAAKEMGIEKVAIEVPKGQVEQFLKEFNSPEAAAQPKAEEVKPTTKAAEKVETKTNTKAFFGTKKTAQEVSKQNKKEENEKQQSEGNENNYVSPSGEVLNTPTNEEGFADAEREVADAEKATGIRVGELPINDIAVRPDIFQFKAMDEKSGINKSEKIEGKFDKNLAATIAVWEDKKGELGEVGKVYVVDGHHRMEFAKRSGQSDMNVFYIDAETAKDARVIGAKANISQGRGTSIDAAKVYREASKEQLEGFEPSSQVAKEGNALSKLNDDVFDKVAQGVVSKKVGIALSQVDENMQSEVLPLVNKFANNPIATQDKLARYAKKLQQRIKDGNIEVKKIATLFGEETELDVQNDATVESELINAIKSDARLFNAVKNNKDVLEEANNQIDTEKASEETQRAKIAAGLFDTYITRKSVNEIYTKAANAYKTAKTKVEKQRIITNAANDIKNAIQKELDSDINGKPQLSATKPPTTITKKAFDKLISILKKAFPNTKVFTDEKTVVAKLKEYGYDVAKFMSQMNVDYISSLELSEKRNDIIGYDLLKKIEGEYIKTNEKIVDNDFDEDDAEKYRTIAYKVSYNVLWSDMDSSSNPDERSFDNIDDAYNYAQSRGDYWNSYSQHANRIELSFEKVELDKNGNLYEETGNKYNLESLENIDSDILNGIKESGGEVYVKDFGTREDGAKELESEAYNSLGDALEKTFKAKDGNEYKVVHAGRGKYSYLIIEDMDGNEIDRVQLRISDHTYNPRNNDSDAREGKFISVEIANVNETAKKFNTSYSLRFDGENTFDEVLGKVEARLDEIINEKVDFGGNSNNVQFLKTPNGVIYGAKFPDGSVYLNEGAMSASAPIHEFSHLWEALMPEEWAKGLEIFKNSTGFKRALAAIEANKSYSNLTTEQKASEALNTLIGVKGEGYYRGGAMLSKFQNWLKGFIKALAAKLKLRDITPDDKLEQFVGKVLGDLMGGKEIVQNNIQEKIASGGVKFNNEYEESSAFKKWVGNNELVSGEEVQNIKTGQPVIVRGYHGTTHDFYEFDSSVKGNIEGHLGKVNYFTTNEDDASENYLSTGADITSRVENYRERVIQTLEDEVDSELEDEAREEAIRDVVAEYYPDFDNSSLDYNMSLDEVADRISSFYLLGGDERVLDVYIKLNNPIVLGNGSTWFDALEIDETYLDEATQEVAEEYGISEQEAKDEYGYEIRDRAIEKQGEGNKVVEALENALSDNGYDSSLALQILVDNYYETEVDLDKIEKALRKAELYENDNNEIAGSQVIADLFKNLGFDGIILTDVSERFKNMGLDESTSHIHVFDEFKNQIKLADGKNTTFNPESNDIRLMAVANESISARIGELSKLMDSIDAATTTSELKGAKAAYEKELSKDEKLKYIVTNFANITNQLQAKGVLTKIGKCP